MTDDDNALRAAALRYIKGGWSVIPVHYVHTYADGRKGCSCTKGPGCTTPGKHPVDKDWPNRGTLSAADVYELWNDEGEQWNVGVVTGAASGMWALDIDPGKGGDATFASLVDEYGPMPVTGVNRTGSGGRHLLFKVPVGLPIPTTSGALGAGIDTRGDKNGMIVMPPSVSATGSYSVLLDAPLAETPAWLQQRFAEVNARRAVGRDITVVEREPIDIAGLPTRLRDRLADLDITDRSAHFHGTVAACRRAGLSQAQTVSALEVWCEVVGKFDGRVASEVARSWGKLDDADPANSVEAWLGEDTSGLPAELSELVAACRAYQDIPDPTHIFVVAAAAATRDIGGEAVWVLIVGAPSSGKTESLRALSSVVDAHIDDVTAAGLLSWKGGKHPRPTGLLTRVGSCALVTFGDLSTLLASSDRGGRDLTFAALRRVYDGSLVRDLGTAPEPLEWSGRLTVVGAVTGAIDTYAVHADALGSRWLYVRLPERDMAGKRAAASMAKMQDDRIKREAFGAKMAQVVYSARQRIAAVELSEEMRAEIDGLAMVTCWGRASVPRNGYGAREIDGPPTVEEPSRVVRQLRGMARGLYALGLPEGHVRAVLRRVAADSMPLTRYRSLRALALSETPLSTAAAATAAKLHRHVARRALEELEVIGVVLARRVGPEPEDDHSLDRRRAEWHLSGPEGESIAAVFKALDEAERRGWHET